MAATSNPIAAADLDARLADKPCLVGRNGLLVSAIGNLRTNTVGDLATADASAANRDRKYLIDRFRHTYWQGNAAATAWYVIADLGTNPQFWDVAILDHDGTLNGCTLTVKGDAVTPPAGAAWAGSTTIINAAAIGAGIFASFQAANEWKSQFVRFELNKATAFTPAIRGLWLGKAVQLPVRSNYGSEPLEAFVGGGIEHETGSGILWNYQTRTPRAARVQTFTFAERPKDGATLLALADLYRNANALAGGTKACWYFENPTTTPGAPLLVVPREREFKPVERDTFITDWRFTYREQGGV